jgi:hypothetical protein
MGSLLNVIAVTVASNAPAALEVAAVKVRTERPPITAADGENDAVTPPGRPLALSVTGVPRRSAAAWNEMAIRSALLDRDRRRTEPHCVVAVRRGAGASS